MEDSLETFDEEHSFDSDSSSSSEDVFIAYLLHKRKKRRTISRNIWVTPFRLYRELHGCYYKLLPQLNDTEFRRYLRVTREQFYEIHSYIQKDIKKQFTSFRLPIPTEEKMAVCLRFLASGATFRDLGFHFRLGESTISKAVREVCTAIWNNMQPEFMPTPTQEFWRERAEEFKLRLHFPNCLTAIDGKHVIIRKPLKSGSNYFNYKQSFSIVLLAAVDANYKFCIVDIGTKGRFCDGFTFTNCNFGKRLLSNTLDIPKPKPIDNSDEEVPYVFVADAAFPLLENLMRPYPGVKTKSSIPNRIFNYRLSRARQQVEYAFGILAARFRIYGRALEIQPRNVELLIKCTTVLHNYLRSYITYEEELESLALEDFVEPAGQLVNLSRTRSRSSNVAFKVREQFRTYFNSEEGSVPWQLDAIKRGKY